MEILGLKKANCKNCYKCIRECPVKSIKFEEHQAHILSNDCILCGRCMVACPQNAKVARCDTPQVKAAIAAGKRVIASVAPSFIADFPVAGFGVFREYLKSLGFSDAMETAEGAYLVKTEYEAIVREKRQDAVVTTCCPSIVKLAQKYYPGAVKYLAPVLSPMQAHGQYIKEKYPDAYVVFIGPCLSKKREAEEYPGTIDCVLTFDDIRAWSKEEGCDFHPQIPGQDGGYTSRFFPQTGGILKTMAKESAGWHYRAIDGVENCMRALEDLQNGGLSGYFLEMSACVGSCINGPLAQNYKQKMLATEGTLEEFARPDGAVVRDFDVTLAGPIAKSIRPQEARTTRPGERAILEVLAKMGKTKPEDELNCGTCGYPTCRDKAVAVLAGKADITMCLPYMKERAESFSDQIIRITPNAILVLDEQLTVQQINSSARRLFHLKDGSGYIGSPIVDFMDPTDFFQVVNTGQSISDKKCYLREIDAYVELSIIYDKQNRLVIGIMKDITHDEKENEKAKEIRAKTVDVADKVIEKQMRIVQEIASLLGETTAETKIALTNLKNAVYDEEPKR